MGVALVNGVETPGYVTLVMAVTALAGVQMIMLGMIGEYTGRIYYEVKGRPHFLVKATKVGEARQVEQTEEHAACGTTKDLTPEARPMPERRLSGQIIVFALVGVVNTAIYYGLYLLFLNWLPCLGAHIVAFVLSMTGSFFLNARFTYRTRPTWRTFLLFPLTNATNFLITTAGVYVIVDVLHAGNRFAPLLASGAAIPVTFAGSRVIMLRGSRPR